MKKRMAIICSTDYKSYPIGGMMSFILDILPYLNKYFEIELWGVDLIEGSHNYMITIGETAYPFCSFGRISTAKKKLIPNILRIMPTITMEMQNILNKKYDILYFHGIPLELPFLRKRSAAPLIVSHIHGITNPFSSEENPVLNNALVVGLYEKLREYVVNKSDLVAIAADSPSYARFMAIFRNADRNKIFKIHNFADPDIFHPMDKRKIRDELNIPNGHKLVIFTGRLSLQKDPLLLVKTFFEVKRVMEKGISLVMIGTGGLKHRIIEAIRQLDMEKDIMLLGVKARKIIAKWLNAADVFLYASWGNGIPVSLVEALMCGLPIVTADIAGVHDLVINDYTGFITKTREPREIAIAVLNALKHTSKLRDNCLEHSAKFTPQKAAADIAKHVYHLS